jgi:hypothetical protein
MILRSFGLLTRPATIHKAQNVGTASVRVARGLRGPRITAPFISVNDFGVCARHQGRSETAH